MDISVRYFTKNDSINNGRKNNLSGIMIHSTAAPGVMAAEWYDRWNVSGIGKSVHAFVDNISIWQYMPWDARAAHAGSGKDGSANDTHIAIEICEPGGHYYISGSEMYGYDAEANEPYFRAAIQRTADLCAHLCRQFDLTEADIISHDEGAELGIASAHDDVTHWFPRHGFSMDAFRAMVKTKLDEESDKMTNPEPTLDNKPDAWAEEAVQWAVDNEITLGNSNGNLMLHSYCTRQELIVMLHRLYKKLF